MDRTFEEASRQAAPIPPAGTIVLCACYWVCADPWQTKLPPLLSVPIPENSAPLCEKHMVSWEVFPSTGRVSVTLAHPAGMHAVPVQLVAGFGVPVPLTAVNVKAVVGKARLVTPSAMLICVEPTPAVALLNCISPAEARSTKGPLGVR
jgi:hypothetical protein